MEKELRPKMATWFINNNPLHALAKRETCLAQAAPWKLIAYVSAHRRKRGNQKRVEKIKDIATGPAGVVNLTDE